MDTLKSLLENYRKVTEDIVSAFIKTVNDNRAVEIGQLDKGDYLLQCERLESICKEGIIKMEEKISKPEIRVSIPGFSSIVTEILGMLSNSNLLIDEYNKLIDRHDLEVKNLTNDIWATYIDKFSSFIKNYQEEIDGINKAIAGLRNSKHTTEEFILELTNKITERSKSIISVQSTIECNLL